jgi:putative CocE/NonD family hydrolase
MAVAVLVFAGSWTPPAHAVSTAPVGDGVRIRMSDGIVLVADVAIPAGDGRHPVILQYTPYGRLNYDTTYVTHGYVHLNVDARGTGRSGGVNCIVCEREQRDVVELVEWASHQPWSTGAVGMTGGSYAAFIQLLAAAKKPPALKAIVPRVSYTDLYRDGWYQNGLFNYSIVTAFGIAQPVLSGTGAPRDPLLLPNLADRPSNPVPYLLARQHPLDDRFYQERAIYNRFNKIRVPTLFIGGWFDMFVAGMIRNFDGVASKHKRLIMGPWTHHRAGGIPEFFPEPYPEVHLPTPDPILAWFDRFLKGLRNGVERGPAVLSYDIGTNAWTPSDRWPPRGSRLIERHLSAEPSGSISSLNDGSLVAAPAVGADASPDRYLYDPTVGVAQVTSANNAVFVGPYRRNDQRLDEARALTYTTPVLSSPLALRGPMELVMSAATTAKDTDWVVKVSDVQPDGTSLLISSGFVRASQRAVDERRSRPGAPWLLNTRADPVPRGEPVQYRVPLDPVGVTLAAGHRLRVAISSADPTVHEPLLQPAWNTVHHSGTRPSFLRMSVVVR